MVTNNPNQSIVQEAVSIVIVAAVCIFLTGLCIALCVCRCMKKRRNYQKERGNREIEINDFEGRQNQNLTVAKITKDKIATTPRPTIVRADTGEKKEKKPERTDSKKSKKSAKEAKQESVAKKYEASSTSAELRSSPLEKIKEESTPVKNKRLDTISTTMNGSSDTLQRNDSKNNVFNVERIDELDLNPGLNSNINFEVL